ncbi:MAG: magnesium chelatase [Anaerolineae bacterium]|nr:magnesium chelatase [Anaerolineae bacterium]
MIDPVNFPFLAIVGQPHVKLALILAVINPRVGGVLLIGPRGTGKTVAVRGLVDLLPPVERSACPYGCEPEATYAYGMDAVCEDCAAKLARGEPIMHPDRMSLVELPLNARLEDVIGGINERVALEQNRVRLERGILAHADKNILYIDEINLLGDQIINAILDASAQGRYTVRRGPLSSTYRSRFVLIGSMNPEEGSLRPQIMDRIGLHVIVQGLEDKEERLQVYHRVRQYQDNPHQMAEAYAEATLAAMDEIEEARALLPRVRLTPPAQELILEAIARLEIASSRAEIFALEAARAHAAADGRTAATEQDVRAVALLALRQRRSAFMIEYFQRASEQDRVIQQTLDEL